MDPDSRLLDLLRPYFYRIRVLEIVVEARTKHTSVFPILFPPNECAELSRLKEFYVVLEIISNYTTAPIIGTINAPLLKSFMVYSSTDYLWGALSPSSTESITHLLFGFNPPRPSTKDLELLSHCSKFNLQALHLADLSLDISEEYLRRLSLFPTANPHHTPRRRNSMQFARSSFLYAAASFSHHTWTLCVFLD